MKILISSCLIGRKCAYDGFARTIPGISRLAQKYSLVDVCPEIEGGLTCPRQKHEITGGSGEDVLCHRAKVISEKGLDHTENFIKGALKALELAKKNKICCALLKSKSPSCGKYHIYDGRFTGNLKAGSGVTARLLTENNITVFTEEEIDRIGR